MADNSIFPHSPALSLPDRRRVIVYLGAVSCGAAATALTSGKAHAV